MILDEAVPFALPLTRRFRGTEVREGVLIRIGDGWGEWAPFADYDDVASARWLDAAIEQARGDWPVGRRHSVLVNAIVPALDVEATTRLVEDAVAVDGCTTVKVKVGEPGQSIDDDVARVAAVRAALDDCGAPEGRIRVDVNGAWSVDEAVSRLTVLDDVAVGLEYAEQPCATLGELADLRERLEIRIAVDEGVRLAASLDDDTVDRIRAAADLVVLKAIPLGGVRRALEVASRLQLPAVVSSSLDSSVGLAAGVALAAALPELPFACGLGTGRLLAADLTAGTTLPDRGRLSVSRPSPDPAALAAAAVRLDPARRAWWLERLDRCLALTRGVA